MMRSRSGNPAPSVQFRIGGDSTDPNFALDCSRSADGGHYLFNLASYELEIRDSASMQPVWRCRAHSDRITSTSLSAQHSGSIISSSADNTVKEWDFRSRADPISTLRFDSDVFAMAVNSGENLLVVGIENNVLFFDRRRLPTGLTPKSMLGMYADVHTNEITQLLFHPQHSHLLCSSGEDGLLCVYNINSPASAEAVVSIMNTDCAVNKFGFFGPNGDGLFCISSIETLSIWHYPSAQRMCSFHELREQTGIDYIIDCVETGPDEELLLFGGSHEGEVDVFGVSPAQSRHTGIRLQPASTTVRSVLPIRQGERASLQSMGVLFTAEDGSVSVYSSLHAESQSQSSPVAAHDRQASTHSHSGPVREHMSQNRRFTRY